MTEKAYTTFQVARLCQVFPTTVIHWVNRGKLKAYRTPGGHRRILASDLASFAEKFRMPVASAADLRRVLVVEDDETVGLLLKKTLSKALRHYQVGWIKDGVEALIELGRVPPDLLILDVVMPVCDGARVLATLRADPKTKHIKVIGITGKRLPPAKLAFMRRNSDAFFQKPFDIHEFTKTASKLVNSVSHAARR